MRALAAIRVGLFVIALVLPLLGTYPADGPVPNEQRSRAPLPALLVERSRYPELFDAFFRDNFGGRDRLIRWHNLLKFRVFRESPVRKVIVGRKDWLFLSTPEDGFDIRNFSGHWPHQSTDVDSWLVQLDARERDYARAGARYLIAIAPDKQSMYPELVPARYGPPAPGVLSELLERLPAHPRLDVLDLYPALRPHRDIQLYFKGDTHWNANAGFYAAQAITDRLRASLPAVGAIREADYVVTTKPVVGGDLVKMLALGIDLPDRAFVYERRTPVARLVLADGPNSVWEQHGTNLPSAILIGDSFGAALAPILADAFSRLHFYMSSLGGPDPDLVPRERPDVVVQITVERYLAKLMER